MEKIDGGTERSSITIDYQLRKQKFLGVGLVALGLGLESYSIPSETWLMLWVGVAVCAIGLACYARAKGRSLLWCAMALWPFFGPLFGLLIKDRTKPRSKGQASLKARSKGISETQLKWGILKYVGCLAIVILLVLGVLSQMWLRLNLTKEEWHPSLNLLVGHVGVGLGIAPIFFAAILFLYDCYRASASPGLRASGVWLMARIGLVGLMLVVYYGAFSTLREAERISDVRSVKSLSQLRRGMTRNDVEALLLKTNLSFIPDPTDQRLATSANDVTEYYKVLEALKSASQGLPVNFKELSFDRVLFNVNLVAPSKKDPAHRSIFMRWCCPYTLFSWIRYDLFIEYDDENRLKSARYLKSPHGDGRDTGCSMLLEVPTSKDKQYPYPCPPDIQDF